MTSRARDEWQTYLLHKTLHLTWSRSPSRSSTSWDVPHLSVSFALVPSLVPCVSGWDKVECAKIITLYITWCQDSKVWYLLDEAQHKRREVGGACQWAIPNFRLKGWSQHKLITILCLYRSMWILTTIMQSFPVCGSHVTVCIGVSPAGYSSSVQQWRFFCQLASNQRSRDTRFEWK